MVTVRPATEGDQADIVNIVRAAQINPMDLKWPNFAVAVDEETGAVVATGQIKRHGDGSHELASIATLPVYQRRGIAHQVIDYLMAQHPAVLYLTCLDSMAPFYAQFGFLKIEPAEMTPYFRRLKRIMSTFGFLRDTGRQLVVMKRS
jgi:N-acetylglutamate synthase-like GNAT family acetyltransferase